MLEDAGLGTDGVVVGVLTFDSLREDAFAVSSLFLEDDTGKKTPVLISCEPKFRLVCRKRALVPLCARERDASVPGSFPLLYLYPRFWGKTTWS